MLLKFKFKNYKSYKDLQNFSMISGTTHAKNDRLEKFKSFNLTKFSAIYGANGSGKTNSIHALSLMQKFILNGLPSRKLNISFKLDESSLLEPTYFETILSFGDDVYSYGLEYSSYENKFISEWLTLLNGNKDKDVFTREIRNSRYTYSSSFFKETKNKVKLYLDDNKQNGNALFLSFINSNENSEIIKECKCLKDVYDWFARNLSICEADNILTSGDYFLVQEKLSTLGNLLKSFGTGVESIDRVIVPESIAYQLIPSRVIENMKAEAKKSFNDGSSKIGFLIKSNSSLWDITIDSEEKIIFKQLCFYHDKDKKQPFYFSDESDGTLRLIYLAEVLLTDDHDRLFVIDELDRKFHPQLTCKFIQLYLEKAKTNNNQLIVTTHESRLLDFDILRRDEIWFAEKNENGESELYSLEDFNERFDRKIDKAYLDGRYGGVPIFDTLFPTFNNAKN